MKRGVEEQGQKAKQILKAITTSGAELQRQWDLQKAAQMSVQSRMSHPVLISAIVIHNT
jgi:hypothetical protein